MEAIGTYKIQSTLAAGKRPVYIATAKDGKKVVIKTAPVKDLGDEERARFLREAEICSKLDHPNLVKVIESGEANGVLFQVMECLEGMDLNKAIASGRQFSWSDKLSIMEAVCAGLQYAHQLGLVHRDIKPANLFLENSGNTRILDFGMAREGSSELTRAGSAVGTLNYMAPEQIRGETCTAATDVFATGIVFQQLSTGLHPFAAGKKTLPEILSAILFDPPPAWGQSGANAPEGLEFVVRRALDKDPAKRWQNAGELKQTIALCRFTLDNKPSGYEEVSVSAPAPAKPQVPAEPEKTVVVKRDAPRPVAVAPAPAAVPVAQPTPPPPPKPVPPLPPVVQSNIRFCTACTFGNPKDAVVCGKCGIPFAAAAGPAPSEGMGVNLWILIGAVVLLVIALIAIAMNT